MDETTKRYPPAHGVPGKRRFKKARDLQWGETPFDDLDRGELLRLVQAYHAASSSALSVIRQMRHGQETHPFWTNVGSGGRAIDKLEWLMSQCGDGGGNEASEKIYRRFFRPTRGLLFPTLMDEFDNWGVNDKGEWCAPNPGPERGYRPVRWSDILPTPKTQDTPA